MQRALERLRVALRGAGFAVLAADLDAHLADLPVPPAPRELAPRLLGLAPAAAASAPVALLGTLGLGLAAATVALALWLGDASGPEHAPSIAQAP